MSSTIVLRRAAQVCDHCAKLHQVRLLDRDHTQVVVISGRDFWLPGFSGTAAELFDLILAIINEFNRGDARLCMVSAVFDEPTKTSITPLAQLTIRT